MTSVPPPPPGLAPITILPLRGTSPNPQDGLDDLDDPQTPKMTGRVRSDTMLTTSSSASSEQHLQTPQTPSILGLLSMQHDGPIPYAKPVVESPDQVIWTGRRRADSYGFGRAGPSWSMDDRGRVRSDSGVSNLSMDEVSQPLSVTTGPFDPAMSGVSTTLTPIDGLSDGSAQASIGPSAPSPSAPSVLPPAPLTAHRPEAKRAKSSFTAAIRRKLERSKSSFRNSGSCNDIQADGLNAPTSASASFIYPSVGVDGDESSTSAPTTDGNGVLRPKRSRLKSLLSLSKRTQSSVSITSQISTSSNATSQSGYQNGSAIALVPSGSIPVLQSGAHVPTPEDVIIRDFALVQAHDVTVDDEQSRTSSQDILGAPFAQTPATLSPQLDKGKGRARSTSFTRLRSRARSLSTPGSALPRPGSPVAELKRSHNDIPTASDVPPKPSMPRPYTDAMLIRPYSVADTVAETKPVHYDYFDTMLPRELKVMIMRSLLQSFEGTKGGGRFEGLESGLQELVRLSRVSKEWQELCFDGQLWPVLDLMPVAHCLHPATLHRILDSSQKFITTLSLRRMDALTSLDLLAGFQDLPARLTCQMFFSTSPSLSLDSLHTLDLRGCKRLESNDICTLIAASPNLAHVNLKGVQAVSSQVMYALATCKHLESLDVSRCWDITLGSMVIFLERLDDDQAAGLRTLNVGGLRSFGHSAAAFLPLVAKRLINLETLNLQGCYVYDEDFATFGFSLDELDRVSSINHLNISSCQRLTCKTFGSLARRLPHLIKLEAAGLPEAFHEREEVGQELISLIKSTPRLQKLDLEGTGIYGGVNDRLLDTLSCGRDDDGQRVGRAIVEIHLGFAKTITPEALVRLIRACPNLRVLDADNTPANNAVMREFMRRRSESSASLSVIDCRTITQSAYDAVLHSSRARQGWGGWAAVPFAYDGDTELSPKPVLKTFYSWRRVGVPRGWRETRAEAERASVEEEAEEGDANEANKGKAKAKAKGKAQRPGMMARRSSWWRGDEWEEDNMRAGCTTM